MSDMDQRERLLRQDGYFLGIVTLSLLVGMDFSPYFEPGMVVVRPLLFSFSISSPLLIFYFTSLFLALASVVIGGVPAAIYERAKGLRESDGTSLLIWMASVGVIALPAILKLLKFT